MSGGIVYDENVRVLVHTGALGDNAAPTAAEIAGSVDYSDYVPPDGIAFGLGNSRVASASINNAFDGERMGRYQAQLAITFKRQLLDGTQTAWDDLGARKVTGTVIILPFGDGGVGDDCYVFPDFETGIPELNNPSANSEQTFTVPMAIGTAPELTAVIAA